MQTKELVIGCLTVVAGCANVGAACYAQECNTGADLAAGCKNKGVKVVVSNDYNGLDVLAENKNTGVDLDGTKGCNVKIEVSAALVCYVGSDYELFWVTEGPLIVSNGYFMVHKDGN